MADVAEVAGVSHQTVSRVLNDFPGVRPATRARVLAAIDELGYRRNVAARTLAANRSGTIGLITSGSGEVGPTQIGLSVESAARTAGYALSTVTLREVTDTSLHAAADRLLSHSVEALVVIVAHRAALRFIESFHVGVPVVLVGGGLSGMPMSAGVDQALGVRLALQHLLDLGHQTVFHLAGPLDWIEAMARRDAWREELERAGRTVPPVRWGGDWGAGSGYESGRTLVREAGVTAVFVANDQMALGFLRAVTQAGLRVPEDISVVGFDDIPESLYFSPPLTTIRQDFNELGRRAMSLVVRALDGETAATVSAVQPALVMRETTAPPRR
jgi:DNA-binding LacI/PurR family transcriptional regulator